MLGWLGRQAGHDRGFGKHLSVPMSGVRARAPPGTRTMQVEIRPGDLEGAAKTHFFGGGQLLHVLLEVSASRSFRDVVVQLRRCRISVAPERGPLKGKVWGCLGGLRRGVDKIWAHGEVGGWQGRGEVNACMHACMCG